MTENYKVENGGIWISKEEIQSWRDHYESIADYESVADGGNKLSRKMFYKGKSDMLNDLLKTIERKEIEV